MPSLNAEPQSAPNARRVRLASPEALTAITILVALIGLCLGYGVSVYRQATWVQKLEHVLVEVETEPVGPEWLRSWIPTDWTKGMDRIVSLRPFYTADRIDTADGSWSDDDWSRLENLKHLRDLQLRSLEASSSTKIDARMQHVGRLTNLRTLSMKNSVPITDAGLGHLSGLTKLESLSLFGTDVTDEGLHNLSDLTKLRELNLAWTRVSDDGLRRLVGLTKLRELDFCHTPITDEGLRRLGTLTELRVLRIESTSVTDEGLKHLAGLTQLEVVHAGRTQVTDVGAVTFERAMPTCKVTRYGSVR